MADLSRCISVGVAEVYLNYDILLLFLLDALNLSDGLGGCMYR